MQIVIDIPKEKYDMIRNKTYCGIYDAVIYKALENGTPLPKGHGDLVDADAILEDPIGDTYKDLEVAEAIIPADTENGGEE